MEIETALAKASLDRVSRRDPQQRYHKMTKHDLQALAPDVRLGQLLQGRRSARLRRR